MLVFAFVSMASLLMLVLLVYHPYLSIGFWLLYVVSYFSAPEKTGRWSLDWLRGWRGWQRCSTCVMQNENFLRASGGATRRGAFLFIAAPNTTLIPMFWSFGFHGQPVLRELDVVFAVPRVLLLIPLLRDILLMAGAVEDNFDTIKRLLLSGRAVCMSPAGLKGYLDPQGPEHSTVDGIGHDLAQQCLASDISVVPVVFSGETDRYRIQRHSYLAPIQRYCFRRFGYPFPLWIRFNRDAVVTTLISVPIEPRAHREADNDWLRYSAAISNSWKDLGSGPGHALMINTPSVV
jgi:hypothetical protein